MNNITKIDKANSDLVLSLQPFEILTLSETLTVLRVPGGYIYKHYAVGMQQYQLGMQKVAMLISTDFVPKKDTDK